MTDKIASAGVAYRDLGGGEVVVAMLDHVSDAGDQWSAMPDSVKDYFVSAGEGESDVDLFARLQAQRELVANGQI